MSMVSESMVMGLNDEPKAAASLAGVRIERVLLDDGESRHLTKDDITHYRDAMTTPTPAATLSGPRSGMDTAGVAGLVTLCAAAFVVIVVI